MIEAKKLRVVTVMTAVFLFLSIASYATLSRNRFEHSYPFPEFETMMGMCEELIERAFANEQWQIVQDLYNKHLINNQHYAKTPRIPKIIHHIWLGSPLPQEYKILRETWMRHHPGWTFMLWTDKEIDEFNLKNRHLYDEATNYGAKSDIARYEILYEIGGLYVDTDFECLKPFDPFHHSCDFYAGLAAWDNVLSFNGLIAAVPGHPVLKECIDNIKPMPENETPAQLHFRTGPDYFTRCYFAAMKNYDGPSILFPAKYFYPWPHHKREEKSRKEILRWVRPESFAIHHWHVSWVTT